MEEKHSTAAEKKRILQEAGIDVIDLHVNIPEGTLDERARKEARERLAFHLYKAKDRETLLRLAQPPMEQGVFVLHTGEFCSFTDVGIWPLKARTQRQE